ncbi:MAG: C40 family peptidase, partial [Proteobacteria bacterium]|nr:C40 family peptidase [Pseudomonadota bacterium]
YISISISLFSCSNKNQQISDKHIPPQTPKISQSRTPDVSQNDLKSKRKTIVQHTIKNIGKPYCWGGISPDTGFDCSGLIFYTHKKAGLTTPRTARALFKNGKTISKQNLNPADLIFFEIPNMKKNLHVGIYIGDGLFVHAPGKNRSITYARLDNPYFKKYYIGSKSYL